MSALRKFKSSINHSKYPFHPRCPAFKPTFINHYINFLCLHFSKLLADGDRSSYSAFDGEMDEETPKHVQDKR